VPAGPTLEKVPAGCRGGDWSTAPVFLFLFLFLLLV
jgi:hypothetical protein